MAETAVQRLALEQLSDEYFAAWADRDVDRILSMHSDDTWFQIHAGSAPSVGRDAVRAAFESIFTQWPRFRFESRRVLYGDAHWVLDWILIADRPEAGEIHLDCVDVVEVSPHGKVARKDTYIDAAQLQAALARA